MEWINFSSLMEAAAILFSVFGLVVAHIARGVDGWPRRLCVAILFSSIVASVFDLLKTAALYYHATIPVCLAMTLSTSFASTFNALPVTAYFISCCGEDWRKSRVMHIQGVLSAVLIAVQVVGRLSGRFVVTPEYEILLDRPWAFSCLLIIVAITILLLAALLRRWKKLANVQRFVFLISFFTPFYGQSLLVELLLLIELVRRYVEQKDEAARQRTRVAVLQMRPHFIHNTLMSIYYLCAQDPKKAQQVIKDFSRYLQSNFTTIVKEGTVPFAEELEHTRAYLAVEQVRYEGQLFVEFDTPNTFFRIPPLTLQPIVENAVKYGLDPDMEPLYVSVVTEEVPGGVRIVVEDTGPGFAPSEGEPQLALDNIRERLKTMRNGTLSIEPREAGGTRVTVFVPLPEKG